MAHGVVMAVSERKLHLIEALRWSADRDVEWVEILSAGIAMAAPVAVGAALGHLAIGLAASVGGLLIGDVPPGPTVSDHAHRLARVLAPAVVASVAATLAAGHGWITDAVVVLLATAAATVGSYSRGLAVAAMRFVLFLVLTVTAADAAARPVAHLVLVMTGALGAAAVSLGLGALPAPHRRSRPPLSTHAAASATSANQYARWKRTLSHRAGWQYTLRLGGCLGIAAIARWSWPGHHLHWIALAVAILTQRQVERFPIKTTQRTLGTLLGVPAASLFVAVRPPVWGLVIGIGVLASLRPLLKARSYLAYTAVMTPLIVLIMGANRPLGAGILFDRLIATLIGAGLVIAANLLAARWLAGTMPVAPAALSASHSETS